MTVTDTDLLVLLVITATSLAACILLILTQKWHGRLSLDHDTSGVQKIHKRPVPRVGGLAIILSLVAGLGTAWWLNHPGASSIATLLICAIPAFGAGILEDLTKRVSVRSRLWASFLSALLAIWLFDGHLTQLDTPGIDWLMAFTPIAMVFTCFAVGGVTNAVNIIDGINGLASGAVALMLMGLGVIAWQVGDQTVLMLCLSGTAALLGFIVLNFPLGKIFLGDGGAYLAGFWLAQCAVLLLARNPDISTWAVLLCCIYPVWETFFSMYRRHVVRHTSSGKPDKVHFHHLVLRRLVGQRIRKSRSDGFRHAMTSLFIWSLVLACQLGGITNQNHTLGALSGVALFCLVYQLAYGSLVRGASACASPPEARIKAVRHG